MGTNRASITRLHHLTHGDWRPWLRSSAVLLLAALASARATQADSNAPPLGRFGFRTYGAAQGLRNLAIERMAQDSVGFLWVATQDGLYRWDGGRFTRFGL